MFGAKQEGGGGVLVWPQRRRGGGGSCLAPNKKGGWGGFLFGAEEEPPVSGPGYLGRDVLVLECSRIVDCSGFCSQALCYALNHLRQRKCTAMRILLYKYRTYKYCRRLTVGSLRGPTFYIKTDTYFLKS